MSPTRLSRGRRPDPGPQHTPVTGTKSCDAIVAWLLRINRIYGPDEQLAVASRFVRVFADGGDGAAASESQISRWEHASVRIPYSVIRRYEQILGLMPGRISAVADSLYRERLGRLGLSAQRSEASADNAESREILGLLCERALGMDDMSGQDWDTLTDLLWTIPVLLHPKRLWNQLAERLLAEMLISEGLGWLCRCEAMNRMLGHHHGATPVIEACAAIIGDRRSQVVIEPMVLLELTPEPAAAAHLLGQVANPASGHVLRAAWWAIAEKSGRGHFTARQSHTLAQAAVDTLQDKDSHPSSRMGAAETLRQIGPGLAPALGRQLDNVARRDAATGHVLRSGTTSAEEVIISVARRLSNTALMNMPREMLRRDPMFEQLIAEMLFHPQGSRRVLAAQTIAATPYRRPLATAVGQELGTRASLADVTIASALVQALTHLGGGGQAGLLQRLALTSGLPSPISEAAAWAVGHLPNDAAFWARAMAQLLQPQTDLPASQAKGLVYSLGIARRRAELSRLVAQPGLHPDLRTASVWWLSIPESIARSAQT